MIRIVEIAVFCAVTLAIVSSSSRQFNVGEQNYEGFSFQAEGSKVRIENVEKDYSGNDEPLPFAYAEDHKDDVLLNNDGFVSEHMDSHKENENENENENEKDIDDDGNSIVSPVESDGYFGGFWFEAIPMPELAITMWQFLTIEVMCVVFGICCMTCFAGFCAFAYKVSKDKNRGVADVNHNHNQLNNNNNHQQRKHQNRNANNNGNNGNARFGPIPINDNNSDNS